MSRAVFAAIATLAMVVVAANLARAATPACPGNSCVYVPLVRYDGSGVTPTPTSTRSQPTATPTQLPPSYNSCQADPNAVSAPNYPVRIVGIDKVAETVTLKNVSTASIDLTGWQMCSITGNQHHPIGGLLAAGETKTFINTGGPIWNNTTRDDGALYDPQGHLVSYWVD